MWSQTCIGDTNYWSSNPGIGQSNSRHGDGNENLPNKGGHSYCYTHCDTHTDFIPTVVISADPSIGLEYLRQ